MGLMSKLKNILFEEEEVEIPVIEKKVQKVEQPVYKELPKKEEQPAVNRSFYDDLEPVIKEEKRQEEINRSRVQEKTKETVSDREMFRSEKTFNFPAFDEDEFNNIAPKPRATNIMEHEKKEEAKRKEYKAPVKNSVKSSIRKEEIIVNDNRDRTKFKPSPIISPVYGILDKNYTPDEITSRTDSVLNRKLDVDSVRKKAFGTIEEQQEEILKEKTKEEKILEEKLEKARTIDELLKDSSDEVIEIEDTKEEDIKKYDVTSEIEEEIIEPSHSVNDINVTNDEEDAITSLDDVNVASKDNSVDDTLESDLFDLIDSMYENREDGE